MQCGVSINYVFVQRGIRAVKLSQKTVGVFLCIDTGVILIVYVRKTDQCETYIFKIGGK